MAFPAVGAATHPCDALLAEALGTPGVLTTNAGVARKAVTPTKANGCRFCRAGGAVRGVQPVVCIVMAHAAAPIRKTVRASRGARTGYYSKCGIRTAKAMKPLAASEVL